MRTSYLKAESILVVHVQDSGAGIAQEELDKLFTHYGKLQTSAKMNQEGVGLGLTIVKQIV